MSVKEFGKHISLGSDDPYLLLHGPFPDINEYFELIFGEKELVLDEELNFPQPCYLTEYLEYMDEQFTNYNNFSG